MVSIMPGIDARAPDRTDNSRGSAGSPKRLPISPSTRATPWATSSRISSKTCACPLSVNSVQASVLIVNPGGTVIPSRHISARFAPLPPSRFFMAASPSVSAAPKA